MRSVMKAYTQDEVIEMIRKRIGNKTQREFALEIGVSQQYLNDILQGRRTPGPSILGYLGLEKAFIQSEQTA